VARARALQLEVRLKLEIPHSVVLPDGTTAQVKGVAAKLVDGQLEQIVYTVEKEGGAWTDVSNEEVRPPSDGNISSAGSLQSVRDHQGDE
jgi:hypothetical protein